ncbi:cation transporter [Lutimonas saemankumensis]|uniref:heavy-metal-associated domain-containing protein n=1 Tax=Lutimonas saemankumensis TaxID=483016 RepID=UPI001CD4FF1B|nr:heavy metal-associated domain-containing protein [Lutimonas saemankumensis]MCA0932404.1 cation transporter [Lutimonas saemankumensis]
MKLHIKYLSVALFLLFFMACDSSKKQGQDIREEVKSEEIAENIQEVKVDIKGMTCEIGCARLIQSKLYKADGISYAKVSFEDSSGVVRFDQNKIDSKKIKDIIEGTAGGEIYSVTGIQEISMESPVEDAQ